MTAKKSRMANLAVCMALRTAGSAGNSIHFIIRKLFSSFSATKDSLNCLILWIWKANNSLTLSVRYLSIMVFLNDVEEGGDCAFPVADNKTFTWKVNKEIINTFISLKQFQKCPSAKLQPILRSF